MTEDVPHNSHEANPQKEDGDQASRREFMQMSAAAVATVVASQTGWLAGSAEAHSLGAIISETEQGVYYRDRLPDNQTPFDNPTSTPVSLFDWDFPSLVKSATGNGTFGTDGMPANFSTSHTVPSAYAGMQVAVIGSGAAGLAAGYELMKLGFKPVFYEMQTQVSPQGETFARPNGRILTWDWGGNGLTTGASAGWYQNDALTTTTVKPAVGRNLQTYGRRVAELGGMRFPATHLTLRTYADSIFSSDYYYAGATRTTPWVAFRDPGLYTSTGALIPDRGGVVAPDENDKIIYDTVYNTKGIFNDRNSANPPNDGGYSQTDRVKAGTTLQQSNAAVNNLTFKYFDLLFGDTGTSPYQGVLTPILQMYSTYTTTQNETNAAAIVTEWQRLIGLYDDMSLGEVLKPLSAEDDLLEEMIDAEGG